MEASHSSLEALTTPVHLLFIRSDSPSLTHLHNLQIFTGSFLSFSCLTLSGHLLALFWWCLQQEQMPMGYIVLLFVVLVCTSFPSTLPICVSLLNKVCLIAKPFLHWLRLPRRAGLLASSAQTQCVPREFPSPAHLKSIGLSFSPQGFLLLCPTPVTHWGVEWSLVAIIM